MLEGEELRRFAPYLAADLLGATYCPAEGHANPFLAGPLFALRAVERGAVIRTGRRGDGDRPGLRRAHAAGEVRAQRVVNAAGAWAGELAAKSGLRCRSAPKGCT